MRNASSHCCKLPPYEGAGAVTGAGAVLCATGAGSGCVGAGVGSGVGVGVGVVAGLLLVCNAVAGCLAVVAAKT